MQYDKAVNTLLNAEAAANFLLFIIAGLVVFILVGQGIKMWRDLFGKPKEDETKQYQQHCKDSEERFAEGEKHIQENSVAICDLKEGFRVLCIANKALLNHAIHDGNTAEMEKASSEVDNYLINRK